MNTVSVGTPVHVPSAVRNVIHRRPDLVPMMGEAIERAVILGKRVRCEDGTVGTSGGGQHGYGHLVVSRYVSPVTRATGRPAPTGRNETEARSIALAFARGATAQCMDGAECGRGAHQRTDELLRFSRSSDGRAPA